MLTLYHYPLCAKSRLTRVLLGEMNVSFNLKKLDYWKEKSKLLAISPVGEIPAIITASNRVIVSLYSIIEYLLDLSPESHLLPSSIEERAEMRRIIYWINTRFDQEVTSYIINEKLLKLMQSTGSPRTEFIRAAKVNFGHHANYFYNLSNASGNLASSHISVADIFLACHVSVLDYFGEVNWDNLPWLKEWYAPIKSRPSFRAILADRISIITPPNYYEDPDF